MATFLLLLCVGAGCTVIGILFMLYGPTSSSLGRIRSASAATSAGFSVAPSFAPSFAPFAPSFAPQPPASYRLAEGSAPIEPFVPVTHSLSTDFSVEEQVREVRIRPPLPPVTPPPPPAAASVPTSPKSHSPQRGAPVRAEATASPPPRLGVSAPSARARHLEPPRRMPPPMPRTRAARGSDGPPLPTFATDQQRTVPRELDEFSTAEHTFVD